MNEAVPPLMPRREPLCPGLLGNINGIPPRYESLVSLKLHSFSIPGISRWLSSLR
jgi:hypothetical protein